ncbi:5'-methylthioadenosine/S-adenosylhomocysteine nucleosidase [Bifidobacterium xylocopae]|uniref:Nucleoside phosphorylase domain-containing protein n=1 Tax=Bifidobacterium xylocopae TaxID=2493119 RepID=A0A366KBZ4_9BIFI|nr:5'-methylthioadenosine/S-adenosylhomocysteine nucleosidase [Bifidobacterium xylocopae]RBP98762.1 hypothetical protein CRD59_07345 [Bifidobacterium xylocopae]
MDSTATTTERTPSTIAVLTALPIEAEGIIQAMDGPKHRELPGLRVARGRYRGLDLVVCVGGMGAANAAAASQFLIDNYRPEAMLFSGIAGSINPGLQIGDLIIAAEQHYAETNTDLIAQCPPNLPAFPSDRRLVELARQAAQELGMEPIAAVGELLASGAWDGRVHAPGPGAGVKAQGDPSHYVVGNISTSDRFNTDPAVLSDLVAGFQAEGEAMEEAPAAQIAIRAGLPFLCLRGISNPCGQTPEELDTHEDASAAAAHAAAQVTLGLLRALSR